MDINDARDLMTVCVGRRAMVFILEDEEEEEDDDDDEDEDDDDEDNQ
jgi:hypothetical protein